MADSMCGPSNALQSFKSHTSADRSLQQDRLINRTPHSQGFRSAGPGAANVDAEFQQFQSGGLPQQHFEQAGFAPGGFHAAQRMNQAQQQPGPASWANDFQSMHISQPPMQQQRQGIPQAGAWHQEFAQQNQGMVANHGHSTPVERLAGIQAQPFGGIQSGMPMYQSSMMNMRQQGMYNAPQPMQQEMQAPAQVDAFDEEAFARAFDLAAEAEMSAHAQLSEGAQLSQEMQDQSLDSHRGLDERIGADAIHHPDELDQKQMTPAQESDDLARTAGQLLNSVQDNTSDKFQNSVFLNLMRQLRDKEVVVDGDKIKPAGEAGVDSEQLPTLSRYEYAMMGQAEDLRLARDQKRKQAGHERSAHPENRPNRMSSADMLGYYDPGATDLVMPNESANARVDMMSGGLQETKKVFAGLKDQFETLEDRQKRAKEDLRQEALRMWKEELEMDGVTWGEA